MIFKKLQGQSGKLLWNHMISYAKIIRIPNSYNTSKLDIESKHLKKPISLIDVKGHNQSIWEPFSKLIHNYLDTLRRLE